MDEPTFANSFYSACRPDDRAGTKKGIFCRYFLSAITFVYDLIFLTRINIEHMTKLLPFVFLTLSVFYAAAVKAQGCSDAGFCTLNSFKPNTLDSVADAHNRIRVGASFGVADHSITVFGTYLEYDRQLGKRFGLDAKLTALAQSGNDISAFGLSDVYLNMNYRILSNLKMSAGVKLPLTDGNTEQDGLPLPLDYQSSLGTTDLIVGLSLGIKDLEITMALQQPLTQNDNRFLAEEYPLDSRLRAFQSTNGFQRKGDVLTRFSMPVNAGKFKLTPSILAITHLGNDLYTDALGIEREIEGSSGLTLNANAYLDYQLDQTSALQLNVGVPLLVRDTRPDGLTRAIVVNLEYSARF